MYYDDSDSKDSKLLQVATMAAIQLKADKVVCMMGEESTRNVTLMAGGQQALSLISAERLVEGIIQDYQLLKEQQVHTLLFALHFSRSQKNLLMNERTPAALEILVSYLTRWKSGIGYNQ